MEIKIGTTLILEPTYTERVEKFRCKVVEQKDGVIYIDYPTNTITKKTAFLIDGAQFRVTFNDENKQSFAFNTEVLGRRKGTIPMIMLSCPSDDEIIKIQRREFVRVQTPVDVAVEYDNIFTQLVAEDISAGGVLLTLAKPVNFKSGDNVRLTIVLPYNNNEIRYIQTDALVVTTFERNNRTLATLHFTDTDDIDKQYIVRFCFERQLQIRKKELI